MPSEAAGSPDLPLLPHLQPVPHRLDLIAVHGPWLLFLLVILETCFVTGLVVPSGLATSLATAVALEEGVTLLPVAAAATIGDSLGFWIGRKGRERWAGRVREIHAEASRIFGGHPFLSVTVARLISFVRTVMPMVAGMSPLPYPRYLSYELVGVVLWCGVVHDDGRCGGRGLGAGGAAVRGGRRAPVRGIGGGRLVAVAPEETEHLGC